MKDYTIYNDGVIVAKKDGTFLTIYFNEFSGNVYFRYKIDTLTNVIHPGIYLGHDNNGNNYYMHNHYANGGPAIEYEHGFTKNRPIYDYPYSINNSKMQIIYNGLYHVKRGEPYNKVSYNCQTFVNQVCNNVRKSESVNQWTGITLMALLAIGLFGGASSGK